MAKKDNNSVLNNENAEEKVVKTNNKENATKKKNVKASKKAKNGEVKKSRIKETFGELKKVTWPSFSKAMKQTGMVLSLVLVFGVLVLGLDLLISFIINTLSSF